MSINHTRKLNFFMKESRRKHASYFQHPDNTVVEIFVLANFLKNVHFLNEEIYEVQTIKNDPPDVQITTNQRLIGIEITELSNQKAIEIERYNFHKFIRYNLEISMKNQQKYDFTKDEFKKKYINILKERIAEKNKKCEEIFLNFDSIILLIHTDEECVNYYEIEEKLDIPINNFEEIYLIKSTNEIFKLK